MKPSAENNQPIPSYWKLVQIWEKLRIWWSQKSAWNQTLIRRMSNQLNGHSNFVIKQTTDLGEKEILQ